MSSVKEIIAFNRLTKEQYVTTRYHLVTYAAILAQIGQKLDCVTGTRLIGVASLLLLGQYEITVKHHVKHVAAQTPAV